MDKGSVSTVAMLVKTIEKDINTTLRNECATAIIKRYREEIDNTVYNAYSPTQYRRRKNAGGLRDYKNFRKTQTDLCIKIENVATSNPNYTNRIRQIRDSIENGTGVMSKIGARPFTRHTAEKLRNNKEHITALKSAMRKRGYLITEE